MANTRTRITPADREALNAMFAMHSMLKAYEKQFRMVYARAGLKSDYDDIILTLEYDIDKILDTVPLDQLKAIRAGMSISEIHLGVKSAGKRPDSMWVISYDDLADLAGICHKDTVHGLRPDAQAMPVAGDS